MGVLRPSGLGQAGLEMIGSRPPPSKPAYFVFIIRLDIRPIAFHTPDRP